MCPQAFDESSHYNLSYFWWNNRRVNLKLAKKYIHVQYICNYLLTVIKILAITMFPEVLRMRGGARVYSYQMHVYFTQM